jgi:hypothetical protein
MKMLDIKTGISKKLLELGSHKRGNNSIDADHYYRKFLVHLIRVVLDLNTAVVKDEAQSDIGWKRVASGTKLKVLKNSLHPSIILYLELNSWFFEQLHFTIILM